LLNLDHQDRIVFVDETGLQVSMRMRQGRSKRGTSAQIKVKATREKTYSAAAALMKSGMVLYEVQGTPYNGLAFLAFMNTLMDKLNAEGKTGCYLVMDNVAFHRMVIIREAVEQKGHYLRFLPPYTPMLNPIEEAFHQWKHHVKLARCSTRDELEVAVTAAFAQITPANCEGYWRHMLSFLPDAMQGNEF
jgi:hypothetical protein